MNDSEALDLLRKRISPLNINEAIELLEIKIKWCEGVLNSIDFGDPKYCEFAKNRVYVEQTTLKEALNIIKRVKKYPHDPFNKECNK